MWQTLSKSEIVCPTITTVDVHQLVVTTGHVKQVGMVIEDSKRWVERDVESRKLNA